VEDLVGVLADLGPAAKDCRQGSDDQEYEEDAKHACIKANNPADIMDADGQQSQQLLGHG
jgi:hypothetical protein